MVGAMIKREANAAARTISPRLHDYFARRRREALRSGGSELAAAPDGPTGMPASGTAGEVRKNTSKGLPLLASTPDAKAL